MSVGKVHNMYIWLIHNDILRDFAQKYPGSRE
jgi:hypothetical protein